MTGAMLMAAALCLAAGVTACGAGGDEGFSESAPAAPAQSAPMMAAMDSPAAAATAAPAPMMAAPAPAAPAPMVIVEREVAQEMSADLATDTTSATAAQTASVVGGFEVPTQQELEARYAALQRIIVRTAHIDVVVNDIQPAIDRISEEAEDIGGWVVSTQRHSKHSGGISIRVPATSLDETISMLRSMAVEVRSESTESRDVTDEYVDLRSRLDNMLSTEERLLEFLDLAPDARQALEVQRDLNELQGEIERIKGRIKLLEETSAFSLINVTLTLAAQAMAVDAGPDRTEASGNSIRFRAVFRPPAGITDFETTWDFGDGSEPRSVYRSAPTQNEGERVTQTAVYAYNDPRDSPFIVSVTIRGTGEGGVAEGSDTLIVSVSEIPHIQVYAGDEYITVDQNEEVEFSGSFTRPPGLDNVRFVWNFGDGSEAATGALGEGVTRVTATHVYPDYRNEPYTAALEISADSEVGEVRAFSQVSVYVQRERGFVVGGYELGENFKTAARALTGLAQILMTVLIWAAIFSPVWGAIGAAIWFIIRLDARQRARKLARMESEAQAAGDAKS